MNCLNTTSKLSRNLEDRKSTVFQIIGPYFAELEELRKNFRSVKSFLILTSLMRDLSLYKVNNTTVVKCACDSKLSEGIYTDVYCKSGIMGRKTVLHDQL